MCYSNSHYGMLVEYSVVELAKGATQAEARQKAEDSCQMSLSGEPAPRPPETIAVSDGCLGVVDHVRVSGGPYDSYLYQSSNRREMEAEVEAWCDTVSDHYDVACGIDEIICIDRE